MPRFFRCLSNCRSALWIALSLRNSLRIVWFLEVEASSIMSQYFWCNVWWLGQCIKLPVLEIPTTWRPAQATGQQYAWIGVGSWKLFTKHDFLNHLGHTLILSDFNTTQFCPWMIWTWTCKRSAPRWHCFSPNLTLTQKVHAHNFFLARENSLTLGWNNMINITPLSNHYSCSSF